MTFVFGDAASDRYIGCLWLVLTSLIIIIPVAAHWLVSHVCGVYRKK